MFLRAASLVCVLALMSSGWVQCAGWQATPGSRLACCLKGGGCARHAGGEHQHTGMTQAQADSCCAASQRDESSPFASSVGHSVALAMPAALVVAFAAGASGDRHLRRAPVPPPDSPIPRHLLLSVFLV